MSGKCETAKTAKRGKGLRIVMLTAIAAAVLAPVHTAEAGSDCVEAGEVSTHVVRSDLDLPVILRTSLDREIAALSRAAMPKGGKYIVSLALVSLESAPTRIGTEATCVVSAVLRDMKNGKVSAIMEGRAHGENDGTKLALESATMRSAIHQAIAALPSVAR